MSEGNIPVRLSKAAREFNIGISTIVEFLHKKGHKVDSNPNAKLTDAMYALLVKEFQSEKTVKETAKKIEFEYIHHHAPKVEVRKATISDDGQDIVTLKTTPAEEVAVPKAELATDIEPVHELPPASPTIEIPYPQSETPAISTEVVEIESVAEIPVQIDEVPLNETPPDYKVAPAEGTTGLKIIGKIDLDSLNTRTKPDRKTKEEKRQQREGRKKVVSTPKQPVQQPNEQTANQLPAPKPTQLTIEPPVATPRDEEDPRFHKREKIKLEGPTIVGSIQLPEPRKSEARKPLAPQSDERTANRKKKRRRIKKQQTTSSEQDTRVARPEPLKSKGRVIRETVKLQPSEEEIQRQIRETLQRLTSTGKSKASKYRREKRQLVSQHRQEELELIEQDKKNLKVTEFVTANELAIMMNVPVNQVISTCFSIGIVVSINQRLDAETLTLVAEEFGYKIEFIAVDAQQAIFESETPDSPEDLVERHPIVTVMGHVDHGKTSLLDYIRHTNVIAGEAGGITQHIGAYLVTLENGRKITFLDTPGHEAFTAMRARGTRVTDVAIIVIAADDNVMPQTREAINHAQAAGVPIVFAINKIDKSNANPEKIKEELSKLNILVEDWGGKYQCQEISAKKGINIDQLLDKVLLEAEILDLKSNPNRMAKGTVLESSLDKGRGYVAKLIVQSGTLHNGDIVLAGTTYGRVKAMYNERNLLIKEAEPSTPVLLLGLAGAPQAGDQFSVMADEREAKNIAQKRQQLQREQGLRTQKHITLDEIGRRIAIGDFKELNIIVKGDVDGSVEALSDSLLKLTNKQVQVNVIHKSVGQITESDVLLASASNAIIIGFQVRPSPQAKKLAEQEQIDIRLYSIIYQAINEITAAIEGMLSPEYIEKITSNLEVREVFKITKVGTIAGCMMLDGKINRQTKIRIIRDGIVIHSGKLGSLKRFKDDVKEVVSGQDCGLNIENFNDIKIGDIVEGYEMIEVKKKL
ncbi:MAG TPA: translation initiation factor IF-2 [Bacteroidales bacterium]|nr:translation initiation factor IF-2 [Bacteroidales bacterium]